MKKGSFRKKPAPQLDPAMRFLKALHSAGAPSEMSTEELEKQRRSQEILGNLTAPMSGLRWEEFEIGPLPAAWMGLERPHRRTGPCCTAMAAAIPAVTWAIPRSSPPSLPMPPAWTCFPLSTAWPRSIPIPPPSRTRNGPGTI